MGRTAVVAQFRKLVQRAKNAWDAWNGFWFTPADPTVLGLIRLLTGGMLVYTLLVWGIQLQSFLGPDGFNGTDAVSVVQEDMLAPTFWWWVPEAWMMPVHIGCLAVVFLFMAGTATRVTSILSFLIVISYSHRAHMSNYGLDQINAILTFYLCIGPSGAALSVDRLIERWKSRRRGTGPRPDPEHSMSAGLAVRLMQIHFCVIYFYSGVSKLQGTAWWNGEAIWMAFTNGEYQTVDMTWIAWYPWVSDLMTHTTVLWELSFCALVWVRPVRPIVLVMGAVMHLGIGAMMGMWTFGLIMIFGHISFWPDSSVHALIERFTQTGRLITDRAVWAQFADSLTGQRRPELSTGVHSRLLHSEMGGGECHNDESDRNTSRSR